MLSCGGLHRVPLVLVLSILYPPCKQLLIDVGAGAGVSIIVGVCCGCSVLVVVVLGWRGYVGVSDVVGIKWGLLGPLYGSSYVPCCLPSPNTHPHNLFGWEGGGHWSLDGHGWVCFMSSPVVFSSLDPKNETKQLGNEYKMRKAQKNIIVGPK
jgi:hypothetical protein